MKMMHCGSTGHSPPSDANVQAQVKELLQLCLAAGEAVNHSRDVQRSVAPGRHNTSWSLVHCTHVTWQALTRTSYRNTVHTKWGIQNMRTLDKAHALVAFYNGECRLCICVP